MRVAIYCRLSREDDDKLHENNESESIQNQKSMLINYAIERSWDIYNIYCDEDYSGIDKMLKVINLILYFVKRKVDLLVIWKLLKDTYITNLLNGTYDL